jgi:hypothetical protein
MSRIPIFSKKTMWGCPNCDLKQVTKESNPHTRFHSCKGLKGITAPMVEAGTKCKVEAVEREDYVGYEDVQMDSDNRPIMAVVTTRDDGQDCAVLAPLAKTKLERR